MKNESDASNTGEVRTRLLLRAQIFISTIFVVLGIIFPVYIAMRHGVGAFDVYDRSGSVAGTANYLALGLGLGLFVIAMGAIGVVMAKRALKKLNSKIR